MKGYIAFQNNMFINGVSITASSELGKFKASNLLIPRVANMWAWSPSVDNPAELEIDFGEEVWHNWFAIDRTNTLQEGDTVDVYFSNISTDIIDAEYSFTITIEEPETPIRSEITLAQWRYTRVVITDNQTTKPQEHYVEFLHIGGKEYFSEDLSNTHTLAYKTSAAVTVDYLGDQVYQPRSEVTRGYEGEIAFITESERLDIFKRLIDVAVRGWPFFYCYDAGTIERENDHLRVVKLLDADKAELTALQANETTEVDDELNEKWRFAFHVKEVGKKARPFSLAPFVPADAPPVPIPGAYYINGHTGLPVDKGAYLNSWDGPGGFPVGDNYVKMPSGLNHYIRIGEDGQALDDIGIDATQPYTIQIIYKTFFPGGSLNPGENKTLFDFSSGDTTPTRRWRWRWVAGTGLLAREYIEADLYDSSTVSRGKTVSTWFTHKIAVTPSLDRVETRFRENAGAWTGISVVNYSPSIAEDSSYTEMLLNVQANFAATLPSTDTSDPNSPAHYELGLASVIIKQGADTTAAFLDTATGDPFIVYFDQDGSSNTAYPRIV